MHVAPAAVPKTRMGMLRNAARSAKLVMGGATAGLVAGTAGTVHLAQGGGGQSWWAKQFKLQFFQPFVTQNNSTASDETSLRDLQALYQCLRCMRRAGF